MIRAVDKMPGGHCSTLKMTCGKIMSPTGHHVTGNTGCFTSQGMDSGLEERERILNSRFGQIASVMIIPVSLSVKIDATCGSSF